MNTGGGYGASGQPTSTGLDIVNMVRPYGWIGKCLIAGVIGTAIIPPAWLAREKEVLK